MHGETKLFSSHVQREAKGEAPLRALGCAPDDEIPREVTGKSPPVGVDPEVVPPLLFP